MIRTRFLVLGALLAALFAMVLQGAATAVAVPTPNPNAQALVLRVLAVIGGVLAGAGMAWFTAPGKTFTAFARESIVEVKKVVWPTRKETIQSTAAVFAFVVVMAVFLWVSDKTLEWVLYEVVLGWKKA